MKKILIVSRDISLKQDGGTLVSKRNERLLNLLGFYTERFVIPVPSLFTRIKNILFNQSYGETRELRKKYLETICKGYDYIFFDGSIYGGFLKIVAKSGVKSICFYHNVELEYYRQKAHQTKSIADWIMVPFIFKNEQKSTVYSTSIITLNTRDSNILEKRYGRKADITLPTSFPIRELKPLYNKTRLREEPYLLFVGTNFFANKEGLDRFIDKVAPYINVKIKIVGNIKDAFINRHNIPENIEFEGKVDVLEEFYLNASAVIAPIFSGSGLKTKTAEALSYGKTVIGYPEAFEGIEWGNYIGSCIEVNSDSEYIKALNNLDLKQLYNPLSENLFQDLLSDEAQCLKLRNLLAII